MPKCRTASAGILLAASLACCCAAADDGLSELDKAILADSRDGSLDRFDLPSACLIAGGVDEPGKLTTARRQLADVAATIVTPCVTRLRVEDRAAAIFRQMHECVLIGQYDRGASDLRVTLNDGNYNCLTALVLYNELCRRADVPLTLWSQPGHVFCKVGEVRIEPTCRQWPAPAADTAEQPRQVTSQELVGRFYYNRGVDHLEQRRFASGVSALHIACHLDPRDRDARDNLLAGLNNWALALSADDQHAAAAALMARGLAIDPAFPGHC